MILYVCLEVCLSFSFFGHLWSFVFVQLLSVVYPPHSLVCCRDKAQLGAALQRRTPHLQSSLREGLQQMQFSCCVFVFSSFHGRKKRVIARLAAVPSSTVMLLFVQLRSRPIRFGLSLEGTIGNLEDPAKSGVDGPCSKVLLVKEKQNQTNHKAPKKQSEQPLRQILCPLPWLPAV